MIAAKSARIIFAGGGTGGHLFPAIAIADRVAELLMERMDTEILFVGTKRGLEWRMKDELGYPLHTINVMGLARRFSLKNLLVPFMFIGALFKARKLMKSFRPDIVVGTGGYVCLPVLKAASARNITTLVQEQNSFPGISTRLLAGKAKKIYLGFDKAREYITTDAEIITTGNPVRATIAKGDRAQALNRFELHPAKKTILVLGGSQGARSLNSAILKSLSSNVLMDRVQLLWQTGKRDYTEVAAQAGKKASQKALFPFVHEMELVYAAADIVIARAGALTLAEITACGLPAILVPYPLAAGDHQRKNAQDYASRGMAIMVPQDELDRRDLLTEAIGILESDQYDNMKKAIETQNTGNKPAVDTIAEDIVSLIDNMKKVGT